jgi:hypothetical protein
LGRYILAVPMLKIKEVETEVLTRPGRYEPVADNLQVKEVVVGEGERRRRYVLCLNPEEAERQRRHGEQVLIEITASLNLLRERKDDHPKAACTLLTSRRYGRYLSVDYLGRFPAYGRRLMAARRRSVVSLASLCRVRSRTPAAQLPDNYPDATPRRARLICVFRNARKGWQIPESQGGFSSSSNNNLKVPFAASKSMSFF